MALNTQDLDARRYRNGRAFIGLLWVNAVILAGLTWAFSKALPPFGVLAVGLIFAAIATFYWRRRQASGSTPVIASMALAAQIALLTMVFMPILRTELPFYQDMHGWFFVGICLSASWLDWRAVLSFFGFTVLLQLVACLVLPDVLLVGAGVRVRLFIQLVMFTAAAGALILLLSALTTAAGQRPRRSVEPS